MIEKIGIDKRKILSRDLDNPCEKLLGWMKRIVIHEKFEIRKLAWETGKKISN